MKTLKTLKYITTAFTISIVLNACTTNPSTINPDEKSTLEVPDFLGENDPKAKVLVLGTFHFKDAGLDGYKPKYAVDIQSKKRQEELDELLNALEKFNPTKIIVERRASYQPKLDSLYQAYLAGALAISSNEIYQIGFKLAKRLGHTSLVAGDAKAKGLPYQPGDELRYQQKLEEIIQQEDLSHSLKSDFEERYNKMYAFEDSLKSQISLKEHLLYLNSEKRVRDGLGDYLTGDFGANNGEDYPAVDELSFWWFNRNYRIFSNIRKSIKNKEERVLVIFGAGHVSFLNPLVKASPEMKWVSVASVLQ